MPVPTTAELVSLSPIAGYPNTRILGAGYGQKVDTSVAGQVNLSLGPLVNRVSAVTYNITGDEDNVVMNTGATSVNFPAVGTNMQGRSWLIVNSSAGNVTLAVLAGQYMNDVLNGTLVLTAGQFCRVFVDDASANAGYRARAW